MKLITLLRIMGIIDFLFAAMHLSFPLMPVWKPELNNFPDEMRSIFITYHYVIVAFLVFMGFVSTFQAKQLMQSSIRNSIASLFASLFIVRIITEFTLWKFQWPQSVIILPFCFFPATSYLALFFIPKNEIEK